jgi:hypothetical protein
LDQADSIRRPQARRPARHDEPGLFATPHERNAQCFYTKVHNRLLRPLLAADQPQAPAELRHALRVLDRQVDDYITRARLSRAA